MIEKRYKGNKYVNCFCKKDAQVLVGVGLYAAMNLIAILGSLLLICFTVLSSVDILTKFAITALFGFSWIPILYWNYGIAKKGMLKAGHTEKCSRKIALMYMIRGSLWSEFKIMETKDSGKRLWW